MVQKKKVVLCFGNEALDYDDMAPKLADSLNNDLENKGNTLLGEIEFIKTNSMNDVLDYYERKDLDVFILDVIEGLEEVIMFDDIDKLDAGKITSLHDFDLCYFLKLMKSIGQIDSIKIIGVPMQGDLEKIKTEVKAFLISAE